MNLFLKDLLLFNGIAILLALLLYWLGRPIIDAVFISFLGICALLLIAGGVIGFFLSSISFEALTKYLGTGRGKDETSGGVRGTAEEKKAKEGEKREQVNTGKRMVFIGLTLFAESLLISLLLYI